MAQLKKVFEPFGEVNVYPSTAGKVRVTATILMEPHMPGAKTGIALDGSGSMGSLYGVNSGIAVSSVFRQKHQSGNQMTPVARQLCAYLARKIDADRGTHCIYWACGPAGSRVEEIGNITAEQAAGQEFGPPKNLGTGTQLLPAVRHFVERFAAAPWGFFVFLTDGELHDLDEVKAYSAGLAKDIAAGRRNPVKLVLIGLGADINEKQMEELDDLETGTGVDLWDHKLASELRVLEQIFAEVVDKNARVGTSGRILDATGKVIKEYADRGVPAFLEFEAPAGSSHFTLVVDGREIHQGLSDTARVPESAEVITTGIEVVEDAHSPAPKVEPKPVPKPEPAKSAGPIEISVDPSKDISAPSFETIGDSREASSDFDALGDITGTGLDLDLEFNLDMPDIDLKKKDEG